MHRQRGALENAKAAVVVLRVGDESRIAECRKFKRVWINFGTFRIRRLRRGRAISLVIVAADGQTSAETDTIELKPNSEEAAAVKLARCDQARVRRRI